MTDAPYRLLGADVSYYTAKIRAFLLQKRLPFVDVLATRDVFRDEIVPRVGWPVIPVMTTPEGDAWQDTSDMVDALEARHPAPPLVPLSPLRRFAALLFELYADEWIKVPALHFRWHYDREFAVREFGRNNDPARTPEEQRRVGEKIAAPFAAWPVALGATAASIPAIEANYFALLAALDTHFAAWPFLFGDTPTLADCALYGPFHAHLFRDPVSGSFMRASAPGVCAWIVRMQQPQPLTDACADPHDRSDTLPATLLPAWRLLSCDYVPILVAQLTAFQGWLGTHPDAEIPRTFGTHTVTIGRGTPFAREVPRALFSYDQWMWQRAKDAFDTIPVPDLRRVLTWLEAIGARALVEVPLPIRVRRSAFRLVRAPMDC
ncbi:MAG: glutathione S-transferase family protein [Gammaproteobacteria bacterium]